MVHSILVSEMFWVWVAWLQEADEIDRNASVLNTTPFRETWHVGSVSAASGAMRAWHAELSQSAAAVESP
jgi:hypothetical protein